MNIQKAAAEMGRKGGKSGTGESKRRSSEYYREMVLLYWKNNKRPIEERFWEKVKKGGVDECWPWIGHKESQGYGVFRDGNRLLKAHRVAYELHHGVKIKDCVLHQCDNRPCCNPDHLFEGTRVDNIRDMDMKGRRDMPKGESQYSHKLTRADVIKIRSDTRPNAIISKDYKVTSQAIHLVKIRKNWKHIP